MLSFHVHTVYMHEHLFFFFLKHSLGRPEFAC